VRIKNSHRVPAFTAADGCQIREIIHPSGDGTSPALSLAQAEVAPGRATRAHRLDRLEIYYILSGEGRMNVGGESAVVGPGLAVYIPAGERQFIENIGPTPLVFLCICQPAYDPAGDQALGDKDRAPEEHGA
jgi:mannose-6-phosphate isomerase-like protein (cupin superfamily)